ncbi:hypothetical protein JHK82_022253 [Glycine max]|uniref:Uncharacterized protein n=2 Tax=Glycine subgen. Soja TaxID=1462606 RepID=K7L8I2_SOYBN|nr:hypothetical protein JHK87_022180 [Glycine soja]KAG5016607.1 hypothetical protein JHK85_022743 [Glycine max]KAG5026366.1 hypothetical protein JHK86_022280 [Glycine max]KAG5137522.1 hypothetical protein JHK82_022253 [Glycine max]KAH1052806.1 hypothetical protein GYH30_022211 [Glycine max]
MMLLSPNKARPENVNEDEDNKASFLSDIQEIYSLPKPIKVARAKSNKEIKKFQLKSIKEQLQRGFSCMICKEVMVSPVTTPCAHNL